MDRMPLPAQEKKGDSNVIYNHHCAHRAISDWLPTIKPSTKHHTSKRTFIKKCDEVTTNTYGCLPDHIKQAAM